MTNKIEARDVMRQYGMESSIVVLPDEDTAAFHRMRDGLFDRHEPHGIAEIHCVETMAVMQWRRARYRTWQATCEGKAQELEEAIICGSPSAPSEAEAKRWQRGAKNWADSVERMERTLRVAEKSLLRLQNERRKNTAEGIRNPAADGESTRESDSNPWNANHPAINENGNSSKQKQKGLSQLNRLREELRPVVGHG